MIWAEEYNDSGKQTARIPNQFRYNLDFTPLCSNLESESMEKKEMRRFESNNENFVLKKHKSTTLSLDEKSSNNRDGIGSLPDEILVSILSKLGCIEEAARTSIISHRWEKLWIRYEGNLEFDATNKLRIARGSDFTLPLNCLASQIICDHLKSTNQVLRPLLCSSPINSLIFLCQYHKTQILEFEFDVIVQFLMAKGSIRVLELDMNPIGLVADFFNFPAQFYDWIKQPRGLQTISALTSLSFTQVNISDDTVEYFVSNCPSLERLCVQRNELLSDLRIIGDATFKLKYLKIQGFLTMKRLVVSAPNLVSLEFLGGFIGIELDVSNVPKLVELCIGEGIITYMSGSLSTYLGQILSLELSFLTYLPLTLLAPNNVVFSNLKHLVFRVLFVERKHSILRFTSAMVEASPMLEKFTFDPIDSFDDNEIGLHMMSTPTRQQYSQNQRLKVVEFNGFKGATPEVELFLYFAQNFSSLGQIAIDTTATSGSKYTTEAPDEILQLRKKRAVQLVKHIPRGVQFLLI